MISQTEKQLYETPEPEGGWVQVLTAGMDPEVAREVTAAMDAARERRLAMPQLTARQRKRARGAADRPRTLARMMRFGLLPRDALAVAEAAFPMSVPDRRRLAERLRELA